MDIKINILNKLKGIFESSSNFLVQCWDILGEMRHSIDCDIIKHYLIDIDFRQSFELRSIKNIVSPIATQLSNKDFDLLHWILARDCLWIILNFCWLDSFLIRNLIIFRCISINNLAIFQLLALKKSFISIWIMNIIITDENALEARMHTFIGIWDGPKIRDPELFRQ
jgi:hypothetical protein